MKLNVIVHLCALFSLTQQAPNSIECTCELSNSGKIFPLDKLSTVEGKASQCIGNITLQKTTDLGVMLVRLEHYLPQLLEDMSLLETENNGDLFSVISLQLVENELLEVKKIMDTLNSTTMRHQQLINGNTAQLDGMRAEMQELETYDIMQVVKTQRENQQLREDLIQYRKDKHPIIQPTQPPQGNCSHGQFLNITGPRVYTAGEYPGSYMYGAWGRDPKPAVGKENWYWLVVLTTSNVYSNFVRLYSSLSSLIIAVSKPGNVIISSANPTTNTIQGPNVVLYGDALYYNCYNRDAVCRFSLSTKTVSTLQLPKGTRFNSKGNFCHLDQCYVYTDLDLATDESGVWVIYTTTQNYGNLVLSKVEEGVPPTLGQTWHTTVYKQAVTNTFMVCGVLYATRYVDKEVEEIFYSFDTTTGKERFDIGVFIRKMTSNIQSLNYSPVDQMLHAYSDSFMVSYEVLFSLK